LTESGLLSGALTTNMYPKFRCQPTCLRVESTETPFTSRFKKGEVVRIPIAHKEGNFYANEATLAQLEHDDLVVFRYVDAEGHVTDEVNPNGSQENIAGIVSTSRNVLGMMPHPERAAEEILGSKDGLKVFQSMADYITGSA